MIELKSRFWLPSNDYMLYSDKEDDDYLIYFEGNRLNVQWYNPAFAYIEGGEVVESEGYETQKSIQMLYTGYEDKFDSPVYEYDIVKCRYGLIPNQLFLGIVCMMDGAWTVSFSHLLRLQRPKTQFENFNREFDYLKMFSPRVGNWIERVGNIFENLDVLEQVSFEGILEEFKSCGSLTREEIGLILGEQQ